MQRLQVGWEDAAEGRNYLTAEETSRNRDVGAALVVIARTQPELPLSVGDGSSQGKGSRALVIAL